MHLPDFHAAFADAWLFGFAFEVVNQTSLSLIGSTSSMTIETERIFFFKAGTVDDKLFGVGRKSEGCLE